MAPCQASRRENARENNGSCFPRGGWRITVFSTGSIPRARAGRESVTRFSHSSCTGLRGAWGNENTVARKMVKISPMLQESK